MNYNNDENTEMWDWQDEDYGLQTNASDSIWSNVSENQDDLSYVFNETTPAKSLEDMAYQVTDNDAENINKGTEPHREAYSQAKRRRVLHFDNEVLDVDIMPLCDEDFSSVYLKSKACPCCNENVVMVANHTTWLGAVGLKVISLWFIQRIGSLVCPIWEREASLEEALSDMTQWVAGFADDASGSGNEGLDQSSDGWLADCLINDTEMHLSTDDLNPSGSTAVHIDLTESNNSEPENGGGTAPTPHQNIIFKGKKSIIKTPTKMASSVVLPFAFVKPYGMQGAVTLKDINQKILTPPPSKSKKKRQNPTKSYPTSAFSGKPVVGKTKIRTEGGKGSITIMRTKG